MAMDKASQDLPHSFIVLLAIRMMIKSLHGHPKQGPCCK